MIFRAAERRSLCDTRQKTLERDLSCINSGGLQTLKTPMLVNVISMHLVALHGELGIERREWIEKRLGEIALFGPNSLTVLDLTAVCYADTTLLNALRQVKKRIGELPGSDIYVVAPKYIERLFRITELDRTFPVFESVQSARWHGLASQIIAADVRPALRGWPTGNGEIPLAAEVEAG